MRCCFCRKNHGELKLKMYPPAALLVLLVASPIKHALACCLRSESNGSADFMDGSASACRRRPARGGQDTARHGAQFSTGYVAQPLRPWGKAGLERFRSRNHGDTDRQTDRQTDRETNRQTGQTDYEPAF